MMENNLLVFNPYGLSDLDLFVFFEPKGELAGEHLASQKIQGRGLFQVLRYHVKRNHFAFVIDAQVDRELPLEAREFFVELVLERWLGQELDNGFVYGFLQLGFVCLRLCLQRWAAQAAATP